MGYDIEKEKREAIEAGRRALNLSLIHIFAITNLPPRKMMGIESCGMLLSAVNNLKDSEEEELHLLMVDNHIPAGAKLY